ncbi:MAG: ABC transporter ATP-binding protein [Bulleidia sp.]|nr:ABC transporter ATP-binding protein [Bulleidia sp.]
MKPSILYYFKKEWKSLTIVTITGLIYNFGLILGPYFEGKLTQSIYDYFQQSISFQTIVKIVLLYLFSISIVQISRFYKRNYVRIFANNTNKRFKQKIYQNILYAPRLQIKQEQTGELLTKAVIDADDCSEGIRKFTTELFDTCIALIAYLCMLFHYDIKITLLCIVCIPVSYLLAEKMKTLVQRTSEKQKQITAALNETTLDLTSNAMMYRIYGCEENRMHSYENTLQKYETASIKANIPFMAFPPLYFVITLLGLFPILYSGCHYVIQGTWNIDIFTTYVACFLKLATKSSKSAKLFNAVHKAQISWKRLSPYLLDPDTSIPSPSIIPSLTVKDLSFHYPNANDLFKHISFTLQKGEILGVCGKVASGKSTFGKVFLQEMPYEGFISIEKQNITYLGHDLQLLNDTIEHNITLGKDIDILPYMKLVCIDQEVEQMEQGIHTMLGNGGILLSKGQAQRIALARTLVHASSLIILDDPFSALDIKTEQQVFHNIQSYCKDKMIILISHRLSIFQYATKVLLLEDTHATLPTHDNLCQTSSTYKTLLRGTHNDSQHM